MARKIEAKVSMKSRDRKGQVLPLSPSDSSPKTGEQPGMCLGSVPKTREQLSMLLCFFMPRLYFLRLFQRLFKISSSVTLRYFLSCSFENFSALLSCIRE